MTTTDIDTTNQRPWVKAVLAIRAIPADEIEEAERENLLTILALAYLRSGRSANGYEWLRPMLEAREGLRAIRKRI